MVVVQCQMMGQPPAVYLAPEKKDSAFTRHLANLSQDPSNLRSNETVCNGGATT